MKAILAVIALAALTACTTATPVARKFPDLPPGLKTSCEPLKDVPQTKKLSEVLEVVTDNYALYHECEIKVETWVEWYTKQKEIFDSVK